MNDDEMNYEPIDEMTPDELVDEEIFTNEPSERASLRDLFTDSDFDESDDEIPVSKTITEITEIAQPIKIITSVGAEVDSKGLIKPNCKFVIERSLTLDDDEFDFMETDFEALVEKVKMTIAELKGEN